MNYNTGGTAFPAAQYAMGVHPSGYTEGMSLRDYFAAKAMEAQIFEPFQLRNEVARETIAERAYEMADAMLKAREGR